MKKLLFIVLTVVLLVVATDVTAEAQQRGQNQPGATQGSATTGEEMMAPFDPRYLLGEWEIEWNPPDTGLIPGGKYTGTEMVTHVDNKYLKLAVKMENEDGSQLNGQGLMFYDWGLNGQSLVRYVVYDNGLALLQAGTVGGDLGGYYSTFWKSPEIMANDNTYLLQGRSYYVSPAAYRVNQQISINGEDFFNFGIMWLTKEMAIPPSGQ
jgi:hypothetical protein